MYDFKLNILLISFSLFICSHAIKYQADNKTTTLEDLRHVFDAPNCSHEGMVCKTLRPAEVERYLETEVNRSVDKLCLIIKPSKVWGNRTVSLTPLRQLTALKWFWIQSQQLLNGTIIRLYRVRLLFPDMESDTPPLTRFFINIPTAHGATETMAQFISKLDQLEVLSFANTMNFNKKNWLGGIINNTVGKPIQALSLQGFQNIAYYRDIFVMDLNITELLWPMRNSPLQYLDLSYNNLLSIQPGISSVSKNLRILDVSHNNLVSADNKGMLIEMMLHPKIEVLYINNQGSTDDLRHRVKRELVQTENKKVHDHESFITLLHHCMDKLGVTLFQLSNKTILCEVLYCVDERYLKYIPCEALPSFQDLKKFIDFSCLYDLKMPIARNLRELYADDLHIPATGKIPTNTKKLCLGPNNIETITFSNNKLLVKDIYFEENTKYMSISGLDGVSNLDLSNNDLQISLYNTVLQSLTSIKELLLSGNYITLNDSNICENDVLLENLDLSNNNIDKLPEKLIENCTNLKSLDISQNHLTDVDSQFSMSSKINFLNASNNRIRTMSKNTIRNMKQAGRNGPLMIDLSNNPWDCGCDSKVLQSLEFIKSAHEFNISFFQLNQYKCYRQGNYYFINSTDVDHLRDICFPSNFKIIALTVTATVSIIVIIILLVLSYKCRYRINTLYFHTCQKIHQSHHEGDASYDIVYDAFISYAADDRFWVHDVLKTQLEEVYGFRLCLHYRDFPACGDIADVIVNYIRRSRSIVVILSENSVHTPWCEFELKSAHAQHLHQGKDLILIKLGKIPRNEELSDLVTDLLNSKVYIEWPDAGIRPTKAERKKQELFWNKVEMAIYGQDFCRCVRYCNPLYDKNDSLTFPLLNE